MPLGHVWWRTYAKAFPTGSVFAIFGQKQRKTLAFCIGFEASLVKISICKDFVYPV